jgi:hypothetical protein
MRASAQEQVCAKKTWIILLAHEKIFTAETPRRGEKQTSKSKPEGAEVAEAAEGRLAAMRASTQEQRGAKKSMDHIGACGGAWIGKIFTAETRGDGWRNEGVGAGAAA